MKNTIDLHNAAVLVTGAAGFIGSNLAKQLLDSIEGIHVIGFDNVNDYYDVRLKEYRLNQLSHYEGFTFIKADLADKDAVNDVFEQYRPTVVVNLAAQAGVRYSITHPDAYIQSNLIGFYNILEACRHHPVDHLVYASSSSVYGSNKKVPYSTDDKVDNPVSLYAATKKSDELLAHAYSKLYDIPSTGLRFFTVYGPAGRPDMAYFGFTNKLRAGETIKIFNYGKNEVKNFLIANALFWIKEFHIDGLRVDAVASMLYLDYGKKDGEWVPNKFGGNKNLEAIEFFKHFNSVIRGTFPGVMTIAEESTAWPLVTGPIDKGGLDFSFKWNMGWMHDFCEYMKLDPYFRKNDHYAMTFAMSYNSSENYILPLSHDEVVHLKCSMVNKMPGLRADKYANLRAGYAYMFGHEGKKLLFMGQEFAQEREWSEARELDWYMLQDELNSGMLEYVKTLLNLYRKYPCLHEIDNDWNGFEWVNADDAERSTYSFIRRSSDGKNSLLFVLNMTPVERKDYSVGVPKKKSYKLILNSDDKAFGGNGAQIPASIRATAEPCDYKPYRITFDLPASSAAVFMF